MSNTATNPQNPNTQAANAKATNTVKIDGNEYALESLPEKVRSELSMVVHIDQKLQDLKQNQMAMMTSRNAYVMSIQGAIAKAGIEPTSREMEELEDETIDFGDLSWGDEAGAFVK